MNILVMSISGKIPLLKAVRDAMVRTDGKALLYGADSSENCIGKYFVDEFWNCPPIHKLSMQQLAAYCKDKEISVIFPTRDGELTYFAAHRNELLDEGIHVMISDPEVVQWCIDKLLFFQKLSEAGYPVIATYPDLNFDSEYYVVKERYGAGSDNIGIALNDKEVKQHAMHLSNPIYQPFIRGIECSVDVYVEGSGKVKGAITRFRNRVVNGESQITTSFMDQRLIELCESLGEFMGFKGHIMFQFMLDDNNNPHIIECNCRFGGASTLAIAMGLDSFYWFIQESLGRQSDQMTFERSPKEKRMIRHAEDFIV